MKKILASVLAISMSIAMLSGCGDSDSSKDTKTENKSEKDTKSTASEVFTDEMDKLSEYISGNPTEGNVTLFFSQVVPDGSELLDLDNMAALMKSDVSFKNLNFAIEVDTNWKGEDTSLGFTLGKSKAFDMAIIDGVAYVDLTAIRPALEKIDGADEVFAKDYGRFRLGDLISVLKFDSDDIKSMTDLLVQMPDLFYIKFQGVEFEWPTTETETLEGIKAIVTGFKDIGARAEFEEDGIVIKNITKDFCKIIYDVLSKTSDKLDDIDFDSFIDITDGTYDYTIKYSDDNLDQVHTLTLTTQEGTKQNLIITVRDISRGSFDANKYASAKTFKEITGFPLNYLTTAIIDKWKEKEDKN